MSSNIKNKIKHISPLIACALLFNACGNNSNNSTTSVLIDNVVSGVAYKNPNEDIKFTNEKGEFTYTGETTEFFIGDIKIGQISSLNSDNKTFIQDIVNVDRTNTNDSKVLKVARLLQSLDSNPDTDEIEIEKDSFNKFKSNNNKTTNLLNMSDADINKKITDNGLSLKKDEDVRKHLENTQKQYEVIADNDAPTLKSSSIQNNQMNVAIGSSIELIFNESIPKSKILKDNFSLKDENDNNLEFMLSHNSEKIIIKPKVALKYFSNYTLNISSNIKDYAGNSLGNDETITFTSEVEPLPSSVSKDNITYQVITSPITGKKWLDKNLGASEVCTSANQATCFGDLYQYGRLKDGHEKRDSSFVDTKASSITNAGSKFIKDDGTYKNKWLNDGIDDDGSKREAQWAKVDGTGICPTGFRVPTIDEIKLETTQYSAVNNENTGAVKVTNFDTALKNFLKLPTAKSRLAFSGEINTFMDSINLWSNTRNTNNKIWQLSVSQFAGAQIDGNASYGDGQSVRCIEGNFNPNAIIEASKLVVSENRSITFDASKSSDTDGSIKFYEWKEGDVVLSRDKTFVKDDFPKGIHTITLTVTDNKGAKASSSININVTDIITHKGLEYAVLTSPITNKQWLDRNLGASKACSSLNQETCYGDYYQWGRITDGHEKQNSQTQDTLASNISNAGDKFIKASKDWTATSIDDDGSKRETQWAKTDGSICPTGFRVPSIDELKAETINSGIVENESTGAVKIKNKDDAMKNFLKFPLAANKAGSDASNNNKGFIAYIWSNSKASDSKAHTFYFNSRKAATLEGNRSTASSIRCIKN